MPPLKLYELDNIEGESTSPFVWRIKFALQKKGIAYDNAPTGFFGIPRIGRGRIGSDMVKTVPVVEHDGRFVSESWAIAEWLDEAFPDLPRLFSSPAELAMGKFFDKWFGTAVLPPMFRSCVYQIFEHVRPEEREYFRATRERMFKQTLEAVAADSDMYIARMREALLPMRLALRRDPYLGGDQPNYADHIAWGAFVGFSYIVEKPLLAPDDPLHAWVERGTALAKACSFTARTACARFPYFRSLERPAPRKH
ncbi:glutathione S-transferase [Rhizobiales bacterium GAS191]|nr:glutathione S-transferase [Rhizobiales bacterium GAS191]